MVRIEPKHGSESTRIILEKGVKSGYFDPSVEMSCAMMFSINFKEKTTDFFIFQRNFINEFFQ